MNRDHAGAGRASADTTTAARAERLVLAFMQHWLAFFLTASMVFVLLPFAAPVAMNAGYDWLGVLIYRLYSPTCHQLPQRSWFLFGDRLTYTLDEIGQAYPFTDAAQLRFFHGTPDMGWKVAWSDRMISFYMMVPVFGLIYAAGRSLGRAPSPISVRLLVLLLLPLALDGFTHLFSDLFFGVSGGGFRDTNVWLAWLTGNAFPRFYAGDHYGTFNWWMRLTTGVLAAWALAFAIFPWLDHLMQGERARYEQRIVAGGTQGAGPAARQLTADRRFP